MEAETICAAIPFAFTLPELKQERLMRFHLLLAKPLGRTDHCIARNCWLSGHTIPAGNNLRNHPDSTMGQEEEVAAEVESEQVEQVPRWSRWNHIGSWSTWHRDCPPRLWGTCGMVQPVPIRCNHPSRTCPGQVHTLRHTIRSWSRPFHFAHFSSCRFEASLIHHHPTYHK